MPTSTSPDWLNDAWDLGLDLARHNAGIDLERTSDTRNVPDNVDIKTGQIPANTPQAGSMKTSGINWKVIALGVAAVGVGAVLLKKVIK